MRLSDRIARTVASGKAAITVLPPAGLQAVPIKSTASYASLRATGRLGLAGVATAIVALAVLIGQTTIAGAVVSGGVLVVDSGSKVVQHLSGGAVSQVLVKNGDRVALGQVLIRLDEVSVEARYAAATAQLLQNQVRMARLLAERDELSAPNFPAREASPDVPGAEYESILATEREQFLRRHEELTGQLGELDERIAQAEAQSEANEAQLAAVLLQRKLGESQLADLQALYDKQLVPYPRLAEMQQMLAQLQGSEGSLRSSVAADKGKVAELKVTRIQVGRTWRSEVASQIAQGQSLTTQLIEQVAVLEDQRERLTIRAPQDGIVHELASLANGAVIQPAEKLMLIVPDHDKLVGQVKIRPADIDQLYPGQPVTIQFAAFERATTPTAEGHLAEISPDLVEDARSGGLYYSARIEPDDVSEFARTGLKLVPGMPVEVFIKTGDRTIFSYLVKPLADQLNRAFR